MAKGNLDKFPFATKRGVRADTSLFFLGLTQDG